MLIYANTYCPVFLNTKDKGNLGYALYSFKF